MRTEGGGSPGTLSQAPGPGAPSAEAEQTIHRPFPIKAAPPAAPVPPRGAKRKPDRRIVAMVASVILALMLAAGILLLGSDAGDEPPQGGDDHGGKPSVPSGSSVLEPRAASPGRAGRGEARGVRCWDGTRTDRLSKCSEPEGLRGMRWIFPSFERRVCRRGTAARPRLSFFDCRTALRDGTPVEMHFSEWTRTELGVANYRANEGVQVERLASGRFRWLIFTPQDRTGVGQWKVAFMLRNAPYSLTMYARSESARTRAIDELLDMRPASQVRGAARSMSESR